MPICIIINKRIDLLSPMMIVLKDFHLFLMMIIPLYIHIHTHTSICSLLIIYIRLLLLSFIYIYIYISMYVLMNRFLVCTNTKVKINKRININCCYSNAMLSSAQLSTIRRKQHVVSRISVCC
jgi:hypothetical protein